MIPLFFTVSGSGYLISYFSTIKEFEVNGGQITKIYHIRLLEDTEAFSLHVSK